MKPEVVLKESNTVRMEQNDIKDFISFTLNISSTLMFFVYKC